MELNRKFWNERQQALRLALRDPADHPQAVALFLDQHAMVHTAGMAQSGLWSFEDEVWQGLDEAAARQVPPKLEHSVAWTTFHLARIEDVTMNLLLVGSPQVFRQSGWMDRLGIRLAHTGNGMDEPAVSDFSEQVHLAALRAYRLAVGQRTREIVGQIDAQALRQKVQPARLQRVLDEGALVEEARGLLDYWGGLTGAGLLLMPPTRHNFVHLNEALRILKKMK